MGRKCFGTMTNFSVGALPRNTHSNISKWSPVFMRQISNLSLGLRSINLITELSCRPARIACTESRTTVAKFSTSFSLPNNRPSAKFEGSCQFAKRETITNPHEVIRTTRRLSARAYFESVGLSSMHGTMLR